MSLLNACTGLLRRDLTLALRSPGQVVQPLAFFVMVASLFPMGVTPEREALSTMAGGVIWVGALLSVLLSLNALFKNDQDDGALDQLLLSPHPLPILVLTKVLAHWLTTGFCLTLMAPVLAIMLHLPKDGFAVLLLTLLLGTPTLNAVGAIGAALTVRVQQAGVLLTLLALPLYIPVLLLATGAINAAVEGLPFAGHLLWMAALLVLSASLAPFAIAAALRAIND